MIDAETITHKTTVDNHRDAFGRRVGQSREHSYGELSDATGIPVRTLKSYKEGQSAPNMHHMLQIAVVLGADYVSEILTPAGMGGVEEITTNLEPNAMHTCAELINASNEIMTRLEDGVFDHIDQHQTAPLLLKLAGKLEVQAKAMLKHSKQR